MHSRKHRSAETQRQSSENKPGHEHGRGDAEPRSGNSRQHLLPSDSELRASACPRQRTSGLLTLLPVDDVTQAVAQEVEAKHDNSQTDAGKHSEVWSVEQM